jgi:zinc transport system permease protein
MLDLEFMRLAFGAGIVVGLLAPAVGFFLVQRRLSLVGDGIGHVAPRGRRRLSLISAARPPHSPSGRHALDRAARPAQDSR